jgi:hypothetical protein
MAAFWGVTAGISGFIFFLAYIVRFWARFLAYITNVMDPGFVLHTILN